eukprot:TRINITY_DN3679_c0_g1_i5.p1 TRINITY_DN3679_c0_g1~~TRINITY_DN3679_c0_g1_i5.p1  ORF type:complete len:164 (+),score=36.93 TRINITY_DN3679_c0_g1_i5:98-589(+)
MRGVDLYSKKEITEEQLSSVQEINKKTIELQEKLYEGMVEHCEEQALYASLQEKNSEMSEIRTFLKYLEKSAEHGGHNSVLQLNRISKQLNIHKKIVQEITQTNEDLKELARLQQMRNQVERQDANMQGLILIAVFIMLTFATINFFSQHAAVPSNNLPSLPY